MEKKAIRGRQSPPDGDPLVADLRTIEAERMDSEARRRELWGELRVLPGLIGLGEAEDYDKSLGSRLVNLLREATQRLTVPGHREAATILMRLERGSATAPVAKLYRLAAKQFPGRRVKGRVLDKDEEEFTLRVGSFTRPGGKHDEILDALAYIIRTMGERQEESDAPDGAADANARSDLEDADGPFGIRPKHYNLSLHIKVCFLEGRRLVRQLNTRVIRAVEDGRDSIRLVIAPYQRDLEIVYGGVAEYEPRGGGYTRAEVKLADPPMKRGETRLLITESRYVESADTVTWLRHAPGRKSVDLLVLGVQFSADAIPARVWWWDETPALPTPTLFTPDKELVPNNLNYVEKHLSNTHDYLTCGIAWEWD